MPTAFISYRRTTSAMLAQLLVTKLRTHGVRAYVDTRQIDGGGPFPDRLRRAIEKNDVFVCLVANRTFDSDWVRHEIAHAHAIGKVMIPVFQEDYTPLTTPPDEHIEALLQSDGVHIMNITNVYVDEAIADLARMIKESVPPSPPPPWVIGAVVAVLVVAALIILLLSGVLGGTDEPTLSPDEIAGTRVARWATQTAEASFTPTLSATELEGTIQAEMALALTNQAQTLVADATQRAAAAMATAALAQEFQAQTAAAETAAATLWTLTPTPDLRGTAYARLTATQAFVNEMATQTATLWTPTPTVTPTLDPLQATLAAAQNFSGGNNDWEPVMQEFDGVEMVLVPAGCFEMGSTTGVSDEQPVHKVCFAEPFWIDRYEVSQGQFAAFNGQAAEDSYFQGISLPRQNITWNEAQDFCEQRGARLPTEAEWEYAARGPDGLTYPWGNDFVDANVVWHTNQTADVGSKPGGASWVGALDLSGNVWEWVADWYGDYPAGRQVDPTGPVTGTWRVLRGGSWWLTFTNYFRAAYRYRNFPLNWNYFNGFRCARSAEG